MWIDLDLFYRGLLYGSVSQGLGTTKFMNLITTKFMNLITTKFMNLIG